MNDPEAKTTIFSLEFYLAPGLFIYYVINVYVPRVRANAYHVLTTPPRVFRDPQMCLRNIWTAPNQSNIK